MKYTPDDEFLDYLRDYHKRKQEKLQVTPKSDGYKQDRDEVLADGFRFVDTRYPKRPQDMHIPLGSGRPERTQAIGADDIVNLKIALHSDDWNSFLARC